MMAARTVEGAIRFVAAKREKVERNKRKRWDLSVDRYKEIRAEHGGKPFGAFNDQRKKARKRGIGWEITFSDWWRIWQESGHWSERGKRADNYCMARWGDSGPYSPENVYICTVSQNTSDSFISRPAAVRWPNGHPWKKTPATPTRSGEGKP